MSVVHGDIGEPGGGRARLLITALQMEASAPSRRARAAAGPKAKATSKAAPKVATVHRARRA